MLYHIILLIITDNYSEYLCIFNSRLSMDIVRVDQRGTTEKSLRVASGPSCYIVCTPMYCSSDVTDSVCALSAQMR
jgi:hypothetical protein